MIISNKVKKFDVPEDVAGEADVWVELLTLSAKKLHKSREARMFEHIKLQESMGMSGNEFLQEQKQTELAQLQIDAERKRLGLSVDSGEEAAEEVAEEASEDMQRLATYSLESLLKFGLKSWSSKVKFADDPLDHMSKELAEWIGLKLLEISLPASASKAKNADGGSTNR